MELLKKIFKTPYIWALYLFFLIISFDLYTYVFQPIYLIIFFAAVLVLFIAQIILNIFNLLKNKQIPSSRKITNNSILVIFLVLMASNSLGVYRIPVLSWWNALPIYNTEPIISTVNSPSPTPKFKEEASTNCNSSDYYVKFLQDGFGSSVNLQRGARITPFIINWKRNLSEPYISYPAEREIKINTYPSATDININEIYRTRVDNKFSSIGFIPDSLNTFTPPNDKLQSYTYGYRNGNSLIIVNIDKNSFSASVDLTCGVVDQKYDVLYTDLLPSQAVKDVLKAAYGKNGLQNMVFQIWQIHQNNIVYTNIGSFDWGGGHGAWFHKDNGVWSEIYEGQQLPKCSLLEDLKIEPGVKCFDKNSSTYYSTTK